MTEPRNEHLRVQPCITISFIEFVLRLFMNQLLAVVEVKVCDSLVLGARTPSNPRSLPSSTSLSVDNIMNSP